MLQEIKPIICTKCKSDGLKQLVVSAISAVFIPVVICKAGRNINTNSAPSSDTYLCMDCGEHFTITCQVEKRNPCAGCILDCKDRKKEE